MDLLWFILSAFGLTQILVYGSIFNNIRPDKEDLRGWGEVFHCTMCMGFWVGVFLVGINIYTELFIFDNNIVNYLLLGCLSSGTSYALCNLFGDNGIKYDINVK